jgi:hypothetical protein
MMLSGKLIPVASTGFRECFFAYHSPIIYYLFLLLRRRRLSKSLAAAAAAEWANNVITLSAD